MMHFLSVPLSEDYLKELKDQPTQSDENVLSDRLNVLSQAATGIYYGRQLLYEYTES